VLKVGLTGGIATGKSYVLNRFRDQGVPCLDADLLAHGVTAAGTEATEAIAARFGADVLDATGAVDRRKLGPIVFADAAARRDLEAIVHPAVYRAIIAGLRAFELLEGPPFAVVDVPLLFETRHESSFDHVVATVCSPEIQLARLKERGLSDVEARQRLDAQMPAADKARRAGTVIQTGGTFAETDRQVDVLIQSLNARS
jgi:dephospho-CoA kinase